MAGEGSSSGAKHSAYHDLDSSDWDDIVAYGNSYSIEYAVGAIINLGGKEEGESICP
jgi:hypothetical protein